MTKAKQTRREAKPRMVQCMVCDNLFQTTHSQGKYCSDECRQVGFRKAWNKYGENNREARRKCGKSWYGQNKVKKTKQVKEYRTTPKGKEVVRQAGINSRKKYPEKHRAREILNTAKKSGKIVPKPCAVCGNLKVEAHHKDYSKPLDVEWLCNKHHHECHDNSTGE